MALRRRPRILTVQEYYDLLRNYFLLGAKRSEALQHLGERGANEEERVRNFLSQVLPGKFKVGKGHIVSSVPTLGMSPHFDAIIYDAIHNAPLFSETSSVYPVEMVYGIVEVKRSLQKKDLPKILVDIKHMRSLGQERRYVNYTAVPVEEKRPDQLVTGQYEYHWPEPKPRSYVIAFKQKGWSTPESFLNDFRAALKITDTHIHGLVVLEEDWFMTRTPFSDIESGLALGIGNSLLNLTHHIVHSVSSLHMAPASIRRYLMAGPPSPPPEVKRNLKTPRAKKKTGT